MMAETSFLNLLIGCESYLTPGYKKGIRLFHWLQACGPRVKDTPGVRMILPGHSCKTHMVFKMSATLYSLVAAVLVSVVAGAPSACVTGVIKLRKFVSFHLIAKFLALLYLFLAFFLCKKSCHYMYSMCCQVLPVSLPLKSCTSFLS